MPSYYPNILIPFYWILAVNLHKITNDKIDKRRAKNITNHLTKKLSNYKTNIYQTLVMKMTC